MITKSPATFIAHVSIPAGARVKLVSGSATRVELAGATDNEIGTAILYSGKNTYAPNTEVGVSLIYDSCSRTAIAAGAISEGAKIYRAANGRVAASGTSVFGVALSAASAADDTIEALYLPAT